jgi:ribosome-associated protein
MGFNENEMRLLKSATTNNKKISILTKHRKKYPRLKEKLSNRVTGEGFLQVKAQSHRSQLANKEEVIEKINNLINAALIRKKARIATKVSKAAKERRIESKKRKADIKSGRKKFNPGDY